MLGEVRAGASRADAMRALDARTNMPEIRSFVLAILQADTFGVSIGRVLRAQADEMRIKRRQLAQERAQKAPVKMLIPMVFCIFPALFVIVLGPAAMSIARRLLTADRRSHRGVATGPRMRPRSGVRDRRCSWWRRAGSSACDRCGQLVPHPPRHRPADPRPGVVPSADPYTFTARGEPWVVQSWLASSLYATAEQLGGLRRRAGARWARSPAAWPALGLAARCGRPTACVIRLGLAGIFLTIGGGLWAERPFMIGLIGLALLAAGHGGRPRSRGGCSRSAGCGSTSHGSFPLGIALPGRRGRAGRASTARSPAVELRCLRWTVPGCCSGAVGPLGPRLLTFPVELLQRQELLRHVDRVASARLRLAEPAALRPAAGRWRSCCSCGGPPTARPRDRGLRAAALLGARNLTVASLVMLPVMAARLTDVGALSSADRPRSAGRVLAGLASRWRCCSLRPASPARARAAALPVGAAGLPRGDAASTPATTWPPRTSSATCIDFVYGPEAAYFYDDRFDMFPTTSRGAPGPRARPRRPCRRSSTGSTSTSSTVPGQRVGPAASLTDAGWRVLYVDDHWTCSAVEAPTSAAPSAAADGGQTRRRGGRSGPPLRRDRACG